MTASRLLASAVLLVATAAPTAVTITRDEQDRIARLEIDAGSRIGLRAAGVFTIEAEPGEDVRDRAARVLWERTISHTVLGSGTLRAEGVPIVRAAPLARDVSSGVALAPASGAPGPSNLLLASLSVPSRDEIQFAVIACSSIGFGDPSSAATCRALWLIAAEGGRVPLRPPETDPYREVPHERSALDEALLGCGAAYGTSCDADGLDLRLADASVVHQLVPGWPGVVPPGGDTEVLRRVAWNWLAAEWMRARILPQHGDAAECSFETLAGCESLGPGLPRFPARVVLADDPTPGPAVRWEWEHGTTFELGPIEVEGDLDPAYLEAFYGGGVQRVHVAGPYLGADGEPAASVTWITESSATAAGTAALLCLVALRLRPTRLCCPGL